MKKILLIEDRSERQKLFMCETDVVLSKYANILDNTIDEHYDEMHQSLKNNTFNFENYSIIITHKSAFGNDNSAIIETLKNYCQTQKKTLVFFSGGIDENYYNNSENELISMNSKTFYSQNLRLFLEAFKDENEDILMLLYGKRWKLNIVLNTIEKLILFLQKNSENYVDYDEFIEKVDVHLLNKMEFNYKLTKNECDEISKYEIEALKKELYHYIEMSTIYE